MATYKLTLEYCGDEFKGWAAQPGLRTVEAELRRAIAQVFDEPQQLAVAGRTDTGVHARRQVVSFAADRSTDCEALRRSLNGVLDRDVSILSVDEANAGFDARTWARSRTYCYRILRRPSPSPFERKRSLWWPKALDHRALDDCAAALAGSHDFTAFTPTETDHVRFDRDVYRAEWLESGEMLEFWVEADSFMRHMVRVLVGTMIEVATEQRGLDSFLALLEGAPRPQAGPTAEPYALYLDSVRY